ncbi:MULTISPECIES: carbohydrate ABC transporter permease [unclassified Arthrobacter]|uniref:carbohydrate ABC transporter permease n=1 Tax=unclassified Arthrobacter TaxID=235627 RepID=UPI0014915006|nr:MULTISPECIES: sugar ABC transporter permease [unclassified Arthrobacter]MBE0010375.1 sugar ABC transporter permease [Arthrobacter sp. AET 35A]NOJ59111.1 sugar ABC transporter permease [Arthrobacter sp. 260]NOJ64302.1 sugar ABC transporter permease [Arthrobacter sp. 147(2020)]
MTTGSAPAPQNTRTTAEPGARPAGNRRAGGHPKRKGNSETVAGYAFLAPWLVGLFALTLGPMLFSLYLAFTDYNLFTAPEWSGLANFERMAGDTVFWGSVQITLIYVLVGTPIKLAAALGVAMLLNYKSKGSGFFRSAFYAPSLIGASVSIAIVWRAMFSAEGPVDSGLSFLGINLGGWVGVPALIMPMMILLAVWQFGAPMVIFLAGLKQVPAELYEAASVDGAKAWRKFISVTLPMLSPVIFFNLLLEMIGAFQIFASAYIIGSGSGGPAGATNFYTVYLYTRAFTNNQMGYASAMAWVLLIAVGILAFILFRTSKSWVHYGGDTK